MPPAPGSGRGGHIGNGDRDTTGYAAAPRGAHWHTANVRWSPAAEEIMAHVRSSFLVRWWRVRDGDRLEVAHIQSGEKALVASLADAAAWIGARVGAASDPPPADPAAPRDASGGDGPGQEPSCPEP